MRTDAIKAKTKMYLARRTIGAMVSLIQSETGAMSGGWSRAETPYRARELMAAQIRSLCPFQRDSKSPRRTGQIPIWRVGEVIALGSNGLGGH